MKTKADSLQSLLNTKPKAIGVNAQRSVEPSLLRHANGEVAVLQAKETGVELLGWAAANRSLVEEAFQAHGAALFRGFALGSGEAFRDFARSLAGELMDYAEPSTPRTRIADKLYTSTEYPKEQSIPLHNEQSYSNHWPMKLWLYCVAPAPDGGQTPIADSRRVFDRIDSKIKTPFMQKGVMYVRNFGDELDLSWQDFFGTGDPRAIEDYCRRASIDFEWTESGRLRIRQVCQAAAAHPRTREMVWFNQAHLFHVTNLEPSVREYLLERYGEENVPRNAYFGDGTPIAGSMLDEIREAYEESEIVFEWRAEDVLMLDNMLYAHGRRPFRGERKVLVTMAEPLTSAHVLAQPLPPDGHKAVAQARRQTALHFVRQQGAGESHEALKYRLAAACRMMVAEGLDEGGISGHITVRVPGEPDCFWVNPFGLLAEEVAPDNVIKVDKSGNVLEGAHPVNVAGFCIHAAIHEARPDVNCVIHTHSPHATVFGALGRLIEPVDQNCCMFFENHSLYTEYGGPVTDRDEAARLTEALGTTDVILLSNHGTITCGASIETATMLMVAAERACKLNLLAGGQAGKLKLVSPGVARQTRDWIANPIGFKVEFDALLRKVERLYPEFRDFKPAGAS